jgi:hypothetical protein
MKASKVLSIGRPREGQLATAIVDHVDEEGVVLVAIDGGEPEPARIAATPGLSSGAFTPGTQVLVLLDPESPIVVSPILTRLAGTPPAIELRAQEEIVLRVGDATISIDATGTVAIRGERIDSEAEGIQRIKGAQVRIN